jgi:hypothetical protein
VVLVHTRPIEWSSILQKLAAQTTILARDLTYYRRRPRRITALRMDRHNRADEHFEKLESGWSTTAPVRGCLAVRRPNAAPLGHD